MKIAVVGAGVTGAYLHRLFRKKAYKVDLYDRPPGTKCGISPCAWGTSRPFFQLVSASGLDPEKYVLRHLDYIVIDEHRIKADLQTLDKPALIADLRQGTNHSRLLSLSPSSIPSSLFIPMTRLTETDCLKHRYSRADFES